MESLFKPSFIKDFKKLSGQIKIKVEKICFNDFQKAKNFSDEVLKIYSIILPQVLGSDHCPAGIDIF